MCRGQQLSPWASATGEGTKQAVGPLKLALRTFKAFCERPFA